MVNNSRQLKTQTLPKRGRRLQKDIMPLHSRSNHVALKRTVHITSCVSVQSISFTSLHLYMYVFWFIWTHRKDFLRNTRCR